MSAADVAQSEQVDPTQTATLRSDLAGRLRGAYGKINQQMREDIVGNDVFGTRLDQEQLADVPSDPNAGANYEPGSIPPLATASLSEQVRHFREWFARQQERGVRGNLSRTHNPWLVRGYATGIRGAEKSLRDAGYDIEPMPPADVPRRNQTLDAAQSRFHDRLTAAINDTTAEVGQALQEGLAQGVAATVLVGLLVDRINHSRAGKTRARPVAHSAIVRVHNESRLDRFEHAGVENVGARVEAKVSGPSDGLPSGDAPEDVTPEDEPHARWVTSQDLRVCRECQSLEGQSWRISDIRSGAAPLPVRDTHPGCRCSLVAI